MNVVLPIILAWGAGVMTVLAFFMDVNFEDVDDDIFEQDDQEDKDE